MIAAAPIRRIVAMMGKESRQILRDPSTILIAFILPVVLMFLMGFGVNLDFKNTRIGIAMQEESAPARSLATSYQNSRYFSVVATGSVEEMRPELITDKIRAIIVIPQDFGRDMAGANGRIQVITDGSMPNTAAFVSAFAQGVFANWAAAHAADRGFDTTLPISTNSRFWFNPGLASRYFLVPGAIGVVMTMIGSLLTALVIAREWERGTMEALLATPVGIGEFLLAKVLPYMALGLFSMALCTVLTVTVFQVPLRGSILALFLIAAVYLVPALGQGLLISAAFKNQFVASQVALLTAFMPSLLLSNFVFEISAMPKWIQALTYIVPARYLVPQLQTVFIVGDEWRLFLPNMGILLGFGAVLFAACRHFTQRRIA